MHWCGCVCKNEVETGKLKFLSEAVYEKRNHFFFVPPEDARANHALADFRDWLREVYVAHCADNTAG